MPLAPSLLFYDDKTAHKITWPDSLTGASVKIFISMPVLLDLIFTASGYVPEDLTPHQSWALKKFYFYSHKFPLASLGSDTNYL
jgi:hypothetical protein